MISPIYSSIHTENGRLDSAVRFLLFYFYCPWGSLHSAFLACTMRQIRVIGTALANDRRTQIIIIIQISLFFPSLLTALLQKGFPAGTVFVTALTIIGTGFLAWNHRETLLSNKKQPHLTNKTHYNWVLFLRSAAYRFYFSKKVSPDTVFPDEPQQYVSDKKEVVLSSWPLLWLLSSFLF